MKQPCSRSRSSVAVDSRTPALSGNSVTVGVRGPEMSHTVSVAIEIVGEWFRQESRRARNEGAATCSTGSDLKHSLSKG